MTHYEILRTSEAQHDGRIVQETVAAMESYMADDQNQEWLEAYGHNEAFVDGLLESYVPEMRSSLREASRSVAAVGLAWMEMQYGRDEQSPRQYGGAYESGVLATYHHAAHPRFFIASSFAYMDAVNKLEPGMYDQDAYARLAVIGALHDAIMGNGRGDDERQSALLATTALTRWGVTLLDDRETAAGVLATTWDVARSAQAVDADSPYVHYQRAAAVGDLAAPFTPTGPYQCLSVIVEDMGKQMNGRLLQSEAAAAGVELDGLSLDDCLQLIDARPALHQKFGAMLAGQAGFFANFQPADSRLDGILTSRAANVQFMAELSRRFAAGGLSAHDALLASREYMTASA